MDMSELRSVYSGLVAQLRSADQDFLQEQLGALIEKVEEAHRRHQRFLGYTGVKWVPASNKYWVGSGSCTSRIQEYRAQFVCQVTSLPEVFFEFDKFPADQRKANLLNPSDKNVVHTRLVCNTLDAAKVWCEQVDASFATQTLAEFEANKPKETAAEAPSGVIFEDEEVIARDVIAEFEIEGLPATPSFAPAPRTSTLGPGNGSKESAELHEKMRTTFRFRERMLCCDMKPKEAVVTP